MVCSIHMNSEMKAISVHSAHKAAVLWETFNRRIISNLAQMFTDYLIRFGSKVKVMVASQKVELS